MCTFVDFIEVRAFVRTLRTRSAMKVTEIVCVSASVRVCVRMYVRECIMEMHAYVLICASATNMRSKDKH